MSSSETVRRGRSPGERSASPRDPSIEAAREKAAKGMKKRAQKVDFFDKYKYQLVFGAFAFLCVFAVFNFLAGDRRKLNTIPVIEEDDIDSFNNQNNDFQLGANEYFEGWKLSDVKEIMKNQLSNKPTLPRCMTAEDTSIIPDRYNFRTTRPNCVAPIVNQANCSSSYAIAATSALSDRLCLQSNGKVRTRLSAQHVLGCDKANFGCKGGSVNQVFEFAKKEGIVDEKCVPYKPEEKNECPTAAGSCTKERVVDYCVTSTEEGIKREILKNGPVVAVLPVYRDFLVYKKGIYSLIEGTPRFQGGHIVKVIGWDIDENDNRYWIIENSWGETWGINGFGHVAIGQKQLLIEEFVLAVTPFIEGTEQPEPAQDQQEARATEEGKPDVLNLDEN
eukprot:TRINITY_DN1130_c0_g2_i1.p1 TRINITY_DN1130_c0_g2~~TRINITY_DN1130_c0_g2_i1.p1  ORF type:complete len:391 (+),score=144.64 TRINITY_DN1130_c0_g2_i1:96-1268(+)